MMSNSLSVSFSGLFRISVGVLTLPMSCISAASPSSRSSVPSMPSAARLRHRQDRHVHHVRERVVVVVLERRQRDERGAVRRHRLREGIHSARAAFDPASPRSWPCPTPSQRGWWHRVETADRGDVGARLLPLLFGLDAADADVGQAVERRQRIGGLDAGAAVPGAARGARWSSPASAARRG